MRNRISFLYHKLDTVAGFMPIDKGKFELLENNLSSRFPIRPYQNSCFSRFDYFLKNDFTDKPKRPYHLLYNMATGSGKTLIMAGLILYLYERGYRNFLFFVNSNNIIRKTKDNFLNPLSSKYLFNPKIVIDGREILIKETETFESADERNINIKFTTIQQLHLDLNATKENSLSFEDFKNKKTILIADEAHHLSSATRAKGELFGTWEGTVLEILKQSQDNILLEFTATLDYENPEIQSKYEDKVFLRYDLAQFRKDEYSKEINLIRSFYGEKERIVQALILNLYRQELATEHGINLKPVILFKAKRTIIESELNKRNFHELIDNFAVEQVENIKNTATVRIVQKAFRFFENQKISFSEIVKRIKSNFRAENCLSANNDAEAERNQMLLNSLEDENNPIRAVFAVQKLNEGWDVLNLFDIVRLYEERDSKDGKAGKTTLAEAQLIGRGARYFPFALDKTQDKFKRKFDKNEENDLKILEELYYHTKEDSQYISELKQVLIETGIVEDDSKLVRKQLKLKLDFKESEFYKKGKVIFNEKRPKDYGRVRSFADLGVSRKGFVYTLSSGIGGVSGIFNQAEEKSGERIISRDLEFTEIPTHLVRYAVSQNPFFYFDHLKRYFPNLPSLSFFIENTAYLGGLEITLKPYRLFVCRTSPFANDSNRN